MPVRLPTSFDDLMRVSVCVSTFKRPEGLRELLAGLAEQCFRSVADPVLEVLVVDNEAAGRAAGVCGEREGRFPWAIRTFEEPTRGITHARNRALQETHPDADFVAFIDDDEVPEASWLEELLLAQERYDADVVSGPVLPRFAEGVPSWVMRGGFFAPRIHPDGHVLRVAFTNNVLLKASIPRQMDRAFDHRFALSGGEDTDFFMHVHQAGYRMVWAANAIVHETIPSSRTNAAWILQRGYREWGSHSFTERELYPSARVRVERIAKATALVVGGIASLPLTLLLSRHRAVRSLLWTARGLGSFSGLVGRQYMEYAPARAGTRSSW